MTTAEKLASLEAQIRKDIPRLMELREGCVIEYFRNGRAYNCKVVETFPSYFNMYFDGEIESIDFELSDNTFQIIGHDIMLNDVLEWLNYIIYKKHISISGLENTEMVKNFYIKGDDGSIIFEILNLKNPELGLDMIRGGFWNLFSPYLKDQSEELIKFLYNIIKKIK